MVGVDPKNQKYTITFKPKNQRPNSRDDKFEIFRQITGIKDVSDEDILDLSKYTGSHMNDPIRKNLYTITDFNSFDNPTIHAKLTADQANRLRKDPNILMVTEEVVGHICVDQVSWHYNEVGTTKAHTAPLSVLGTGVTIAVMDTGIDATHIDLKDRVKVNQNFVADNLGTKGGHEHGTHVAGILAASDNGTGTSGIAPQADLWNLRTGDVNGAMSGTDIGEAIQYCNNNNPHILNMSLGGATPLVPEANINALYDKGIIMVAAADNTGKQELRYPAAFARVNSVTALQEAHIIADFSTWNNMVDFTAPGTDILSCGYNNRLFTESGTSMACPVVAGIFALCVQSYTAEACGNTPGASKIATIEQAMVNAATKTASSGGLTGAAPKGTKDTFYGWGMPLAHVAVAALKGVAVPASILI